MSSVAARTCSRANQTSAASTDEGPQQAKSSRRRALYVILRQFFLFSLGPNQAKLMLHWPTRGRGLNPGQMARCPSTDDLLSWKVKPILLSHRNHDKCVSTRFHLSQLCFRREPGCLVTWTLLEDICFNFRLASSPRMSASDQMRAMLDQLMGTQRNGEWQNPPDQEVIPQFNTNLNPCQIPISVGCLKFFFIWLLASNKLYFPFLFISDPTLCNTWKFIFLGQIFCENSDSLRWYVILLIHKSLFPGIQEKKN